MTLVIGDEPSMPRWRKKIFLGLSRGSATPVAYFGLPGDRIVTIGAYVEF